MAAAAVTPTTATAATASKSETPRRRLALNKSRLPRPRVERQQHVRSHAANEHGVGQHRTCWAKGELQTIKAGLHRFGRAKIERAVGKYSHAVRTGGVD